MQEKSPYLFMLAIASLAPALAMFGGMALTPAYVIAAIIPLLTLIKNKQLASLYSSPLAKILLMLFAYGLLSISWTIDQPEGINLWLRLLFFFIASIAIYQTASSLDEKKIKIIANMMVVGIILAIIIANIEIFTNGILNRTAKYNDADFIFEIVRLNRGSTFLTLIIWPLIALLLPSKKNIPLAILLTAIFLTVIRLDSQTAVLGIIAGAISFIFVYIKKEHAINALMILTILGIIATPIIAKKIEPQKLLAGMPNMHEASVEYRLEIWHYTAKRAMEKPIFGWGFNSARNIPVIKSEYVSNNRHPIPLHPHNNIMQIWLEFGAVGLILFTIFIVTILNTIKKSSTSNLNKSCLTALTANYFTAGFTGFGIWQNWWIAGGLLALMFLTILIWGQVFTFACKSKDLTPN